MPDVDVLSCWSIGRTVFAVWFTVANVVGNFLFLWIAVGLPIKKSIAIGVAMTGASYLVVVAVPIWLVPYRIARELLLDDRPDRLLWIAPVLLSAVTGAVSGLGVLALFKQRVTRSALGWLLGMYLICVAIAVYRMTVFVIANPPVA